MLKTLHRLYDVWIANGARDGKTESNHGKLAHTDKETMTHSIYFIVLQENWRKMKMKKITIKYPDDMQEDEIGYYLPATFNNSASHYKEMKPNKEPNNITYSNDRQAILTRSNSR